MNSSANESFQLKSNRTYGWLSLITCIIGTTFNAFNLLILRRTKIISNQANRILLSIATCDSITMIVHSPILVHFYITNSNSIYSNELDPNRDTKHWIMYSLLSSLIFITLHSISLWLTVYLSVYRYLNIRRAVNILDINFILNKTKHSICFIAIFCVLFCLPSYFYPELREHWFELDTKENVTHLALAYYIDESKLNLNTQNFIFKLSFYFQSIFGKIIPSICLGVFISLIIKHLAEIKHKRNRLLSIQFKRSEKRSNATEMTHLSSNKSTFKSTISIIKSHRNTIRLKQFKTNIILKKNLEHIKKTIMLLFVCCLVFLAELPHTILKFISVLNIDFYFSFYMYVVDYLDFLVLITYPLNFLVYCLMSKLFRRQFILMFNFIKSKPFNNLDIRI